MAFGEGVKKRMAAICEAGKWRLFQSLAERPNNYGRFLSLLACTHPRSALSAASHVTPREDCMTAMCFVRSTGVGSGISSAGIAAGPGALSA